MTDIADMADMADTADAADMANIADTADVAYLTDTPPLQVLFLTGQSDPARCALSPVQRAFLDALPLPPGSLRPPLNFPYRADTAPWRHTPLLIASINNARQYAASRQPDFAVRYASQVRRQLAQARQTLILAGSSGLELLANLRLPRDLLDTVQVFAYGPVARRLPDCACVLVQGRRDWLSRSWFRTVDHRVDCWHRDYLTSPEVRALCVRMLHGLAASATAASTPTDTATGTTGDVAGRVGRGVGAGRGVARGATRGAASEATGAS